MATVTETTPKITLYTNHTCPYAHRAHITLSELKLPFQEIIIDLDTPRPQWYLDINPRGLVPTMKYSVPNVLDEATITESAVVAGFLADAHPSTLLPPSNNSPKAALTRARINFFTDTWDSKVTTLFFPTVIAEGDEKVAKANAWVAAVEKEIEPLLADAAPFFGGSDKLTFAEVHAGPFIARWWAFAKVGNDLVPASVVERLEALPNFGRWAKAVREHASVDRSVEWNTPPDVLRRKMAEIKVKMQKK